MLQSLHVKNLALIDESEVEFGEGLNILSGETGAGKSIIIGSINLALGEKVQKEMLRENGESAYVELVFSVDSQDARRKLEELGTDCGDGTVILSRKITSGRAVGRVNGEAVPASRMKEIAALLIDIHGQHQHQSLLARKNHLDILDNYARKELGTDREQLEKCFREYRKLKEEYDHASLDVEERRRELSFLEFEVKEITDAKLAKGEDEQLEAEYRRFSNGKKLMEAASGAYEASGGDHGSASELIGHALRLLQGATGYDAALDGLADQLAEVDNLLSDFNRELSGYLADADFDDAAFYEVERRLDLINRLKSKYGDTAEEILRSLKEKQERIEVLNNYDEYLSGLSGRLQEREGELAELSSRVSRIRKREAEHFAEAIRENLRELNFLDVVFEVEFSEIKGFTAKGTDDIQFLISTNPGEPVKPLEKIASGGELSRIMLAIKSVMAESDSIETMIFDEIDSGISGRTAQMVSEKMKRLAGNHQIICITHLPQIAAMADAHFLIEKSVENQSTVSKIARLGEEESVCELARMLGGVEITDTVMHSAREMKELASGI